MNCPKIGNLPYLFQVFYLCTFCKTLDFEAYQKTSIFVERSTTFLAKREQSLIVLE
jgi:hypothetical protein